MKVQITNGMLMGLIINMVYAKAIGVTQGIMAREVLNDIWISTILATLQGMLLAWIMVKVIMRTPDKNLIEQTNHFYGKWAGILVGALLFLFFLGAYASVMITFVYHLMDYFLPEMPIIVFILLACIVGCFGVYHGLEVVSRLALVGVFSVIALNVLMMMGSLKDFDIRELKPVFQSGLWNTLYASRHNDTDWAMATMMLGMILATVKDQKAWAKSAPIAILYGGIMVVMWPMLEVGVLSPEVTAQYLVACMQMARSAEIGYFIHRYEMIMVAFFASSILVQTMMTLFCASLSVSQSFGLKDYRTVIIPVGLVLSAGAYWVVLDHNQAMHFLEKYWPPYALGVAIGVPSLLYVTGLLRKKKWTRQSSEEDTKQKAA